MSYLDFKTLRDGLWNARPSAEDCSGYFDGPGPFTVWRRVVRAVARELGKVYGSGLENRLLTELGVEDDSGQ